MTTASVEQLVQMRRPRARPSLYGMFAQGLREQLTIATAIPQPCLAYQANPVGFADDVLGVSLWEKQTEILKAVRDYMRVSVRSGHKCGKSTTAAVIALWFYFSWPDARVVLSSVTSRQVDQILWREIRKLRARSKEHIRGEMHELARSGFKADAELGDFREIFGFTAREAEAAAGISGANLIYILDEASGIDDEFFEAIEGNRAGGARLVMFSNPTRTEGEFYLSHTDKAIADGNERGFYKTIHVSSEHTPNVREGRDVIPGLATRAWVEEKLLEWGEDSPLFKVRVRGEFVIGEDGKILSLHAIKMAEDRWDDAWVPEAEGGGRPAHFAFGADDGELVIGVDPAGPGNAGDESAFAPRRGRKVAKLYARRGLTTDGHVVEVEGLIREYALSRETVTVVVDREGKIGYEVYLALRAFADRRGGVRVVGLRASDKAHRQPTIYDRARDELWANLAAWISDGGAIPRDAKLAKELHAPEWFSLATGRLKVTSKEDFRKALGRSPDRGDVLALAAWQPTTWDAAVAAGQRPAPPAREGATVERGRDRPAIDPYGGGFDPWRKR
jgi:phage terminase large subunit